MNARRVHERYRVHRPRLEDCVVLTGPQRAGENIADVLQQRAQHARPTLQMCDALSRNVPKLASGVEILLGELASPHGRRQFVEVAAKLSRPMLLCLEMLGQVYAHDAEARGAWSEAGTALQFHQERSGPVMERLQRWLETQFCRAQDGAETRGWAGDHVLTATLAAFDAVLRQAGAPLDNNIVERALKRAVLA